MASELVSRTQAGADLIKQGVQGVMRVLEEERDAARDRADRLERELQDMTLRHSNAEAQLRIMRGDLSELRSAHDHYMQQCTALLTLAQATRAQLGDGVDRVRAAVFTPPPAGRGEGS